MYNLKLYLKNYLKMSTMGTMIRKFRRERILYSEEAAKNTIQKYTRGVESSSENEILLKDMMRMAKEYRFSFDEYFLYNFAEKTDEERLEFVPDLERIDIVERMNKAKNQPIFDDKFITYKYFGKYYNRDVACIHGIKSQKEFRAFCNRHSKIIIKPFDGSCGRGVKIVTVDDEKTCDTLIHNYPKGFIAEELIVQDDRLKNLHPSSVNTIRVTTIRMDDSVQIIHPFLRVGQGGNIVDNGGAGGIICDIDLGTGKIFATADEKGKHYSIHPDTGEKLIGFEIPHWKEALEFAKELALVIPDNRYSGWDLALTKSGWMMVEGNSRGQFVGWQLPSQIGFRKEIYNILRELNINM